ncbi:glycoside hydrolase family 97 catalytic domain-containing protein [Parapedobacter sp. DT-150]|uniref:glycoside hydrolase family 97 protein n=1 Tax=Parapedobacter sp. DT-150 TaxID=3396162 RepID=UPI003F1C4C99
MSNLKLISVLIATTVVTLARAQPVTVSSPDTAVVLQVMNRNGQLTYAVNYKGLPVIEPSTMGMIVDGADLGQDVRLGDVTRYTGERTYPMRGKHAVAKDSHHGARIAVSGQSAYASAYLLDVRVFNDGVAFRYILPGAGERHLTAESTSFSIPEGSTVWHHGITDMHYEEKHRKGDVSGVVRGTWVAPPMTIQLPDGRGYAAITESGIIRASGENFPGMALKAAGGRVFRASLGHEHPANYPYVLRYGEADHQRLTAPPVLHDTIETPWRIIMIGQGLNVLFNNDIVQHVAPEPDPAVFPNGFSETWMKPGRAVWGYLTDEPRTLAGMKELSRLAGELGFEYHVVEGHWQRWTVAERKELVDYSNQLGVKLLFWKHSKDLRDAEARHEFFKHLHELGVAGAKIDFFDHEAKEIIDLYAACLKEAAAYKLILDFHGAYKPAGESKTWPNEMAREAVLGFEMRGPWSVHNTTLPFTRMLAGHADYTPLHFGDRRAETSEAHQVASAIVLQAPLLIYAAHPQQLIDHPAAALIKQIPSVWDETLVLPGSEIGEVSAFARRSGDKWFISVMNGERARFLKIDLSFLGRGEHQAVLLRDEKPGSATVSLVRKRQTFGGQQGVDIDKATVAANESLFVELIPGGGFVAIIE